MSNKLIAAFDDCVNALAAGASLDESLAHYPALLSDLRPLLEIAAAARALGTVGAVPREAEMASRARFVAQPRPTQPRGFLFGRSLRPWALTLALIGGVAIGVYGAVAASAQSLPGDWLYSVKRTVERTEFLLVPDPQSRTRLKAELEERRIEEVQTVTTQKRTVSVEFSGLVESIEGDRWSVARITVIVPSRAQIEGAPFLGAFVEVEGVSQADGTVLASQITIVEEEPEGEKTPPATTVPAPTISLMSSVPPTPILESGETPAPDATEAPDTDVEFTGAVESISDSLWRVGGQEVGINSATEILGNPEVGQHVKVAAARRAGGALIARRIEIEETTDQPEASVTPHPFNTPKPSKTPEPSETPEPSHPAESPQPPEPSKTPTPSKSPEPSKTHQPHETPESSEEPEHSETHAPSETPRPTKTPTPGA